MGRLNKKEMDALIQDFLFHLKSKSFLGLSLKREFLDEQVYQHFKKQRLLQHQKVSSFSTVLYHMKRYGLAILRHDNIAILPPKNAPNETGQPSQNQRRARKKTKSSKMDKIKKFLHLEQGWNKSLEGVEVNCLSPSTELEFGVYLRSIQDSEIRAEMRIAISNNSASDVFLTNAIFLSKGKDFFLNKISLSEQIKICAGSVFELAIGCYNLWENVGACTTEIMLQFQSCQQSGKQPPSNVVRCIRFEKTNRIVDELRPEQPFFAKRKSVRCQFASVIQGIKPPISTRDNLERDLRLQRYPVPNNVKHAVACNALVKRENLVRNSRICEEF